MITKTAFKHGWWYHYRIHDSKTSLLTSNGLSPLKTFLYDMIENCPHNNFESGPRGSSLKFKIPNIEPISIRGHEVSLLAEQGLDINADRFKSNHMKVQSFMLENDRNTISMEVPIWLNHHELESYKSIFQSEEPLTGHIDLLRIEDERVWIWDYKPNAHKEKYASTQIYFYALMLSNRSGISLDKFRCGYFDSDNSFIFKPELKNISVNQKISKFFKK